MTPDPIVATENKAVVFLSEPPQRRAFRVLLSPLLQDESPASVSVCTADVYPDQTTPYHSHDTEHEIWYVVSGHGQVRVGETLVDAPAGTVVVAPPGVPHQLINLSAYIHFKCVVVFTPAGPESAFMPKG